MSVLEGVLQRKMIAAPALPLAVVLPGGRRMGPRDAALTLRLNELFALAPLAQGQIGRCCCTRPGSTACAATASPSAATSLRM